MKRSIAFCLCFFISLFCIAQTSQKDPADKYLVCGGIDSILSKKGRWKKMNDDVVFPDKTFPREQYKLVYTRIDSIYSLLKEAIPNLNGLEPAWYRGLRADAYISNGPVPYQLDALFFEYYCNTIINKIILDNETGNWVYVFVNRLNWFLYEADILDINDDGKARTIYKLPPKVGKWKEYTIYKLGQNPNVRSIIIGRDGKIPWRSLTQKQYLTGLKNKFQNDLNIYKPGSLFEGMAKEKLIYINSYLDTAKENTLQQVAIIDPKTAGIWGFKGKFGDEEKEGFRLVLFAGSNKYFDTTLPRYVPQLIQLYWTHGDSPPSLLFKKQFEENFPLEKLKAMIDK